MTTSYDPSRVPRELTRVPPSPSLPFEEWQRALASLRAAEARTEGHREILLLSADVIRARNAMILDRLQAGWQPTDHVLKHLAVDDRLLYDGDDGALA
jgi:hypothetical protein